MAMEDFIQRLLIFLFLFTHNAGILLSAQTRTTDGIENSPGLILIHRMKVNFSLHGHMTNLMILTGSLALHAILKAITDPQTLAGNHGPGECTCL